MAAGGAPPPPPPARGLEASIAGGSPPGPDHCDPGRSVHAHVYSTIPPIDHGATETHERDIPGSRVDASVVTEFLTALHASAQRVYLLHPGAQPGSREWKGDIDLLVASDRDTFMRELHAAAATLGFSVVLQVPRVFNTLEVDLLFEGSSSWTVVFVDERAMVLHCDVVFTSGRPPRSATGTPSFGVPEVDRQTALNYTILKRLRKRDRRAESWARIAELAAGSAPNLNPYLGDKIAGYVAQAVIRGDAPDQSTLDEALRVMRARR